MTPEENYADITEMQNHWNTKWRDKRRWIIVEEGDGTYSIHEHTTDCVYPPTIKPDKRTVAARLLQLLGIGPVAPQDYPEEVGIGEIDYKSADILQLNNPTQPEQQWLPIESAPRDGTWILLTGGMPNFDDYHKEIKTFPTQVVGFFGEDRMVFNDKYEVIGKDYYWYFGYWDSDWRTSYINPTHWMPLPQPPKTEG